jgi:hypothetical protein
MEEDLFSTGNSCPSLQVALCRRVDMPKLVEITVKNSGRTSKRTPYSTITGINWLMLFKEIMAVYTKNNTKPINIKNSLTYC